jgi:uncharacterized metal-binding protein YceD (DUF177 family)
MKRSHPETQKQDVRHSALSHRLIVDSLPRTGQHVVLRVSEDDLLKISQELDIPSVSKIEANFLAVPSKSGITRITGDVKARVEQVCVVSLEAFPTEIHERVDLKFMDADKLERPTKAEVERSLEEEDPPEPIYNGVIDLGALAVEFIAIALDPFPRKPGVELPVSLDPEKTTSPFAVLAALKKSPKA